MASLYNATDVAGVVVTAPSTVNGSVVAAEPVIESVLVTVGLPVAWSTWLTERAAVTGLPMSTLPRPVPVGSGWLDWSTVVTVMVSVPLAKPVVLMLPRSTVVTVEVMPRVVVTGVEVKSTLPLTSVTVYDTAKVRDSLIALSSATLTSTWLPAVAKSGLAVTPPTSSVSGRSTTCPGVPVVISVAASTVAVTVKLNAVSAGPLSERLTVTGLPLGIEAPAASVIEGWLKVAVTPEGSPEMLKA